MGRSHHSPRSAARRPLRASVKATETTPGDAPEAGLYCRRRAKTSACQEAAAAAEPAQPVREGAAVSPRPDPERLGGGALARRAGASSSLFWACFGGSLTILRGCSFAFGGRTSTAGAYVRAHARGLCVHEPVYVARACSPRVPRSDFKRHRTQRLDQKLHYEFLRDGYP